MLLGTAGVGSPAPRPHWRLVSATATGGGRYVSLCAWPRWSAETFPSPPRAAGLLAGPGSLDYWLRASRRGGGGERPGQVGDVGNRAGPSPAPLPPQRGHTGPTGCGQDLGQWRPSSRGRLGSSPGAPMSGAVSRYTSTCGVRLRGHWRTPGPSTTWMCPRVHG